MKIQVNGFIDEQVEVNTEAFLKAQESKNVEQFMFPYLEKLSIELIYTSVDE